MMTTSDNDVGSKKPPTTEPQFCAEPEQPAEDLPIAEIDEPDLLDSLIGDDDIDLAEDRRDHERRLRQHQIRRQHRDNPPLVKPRIVRLNHKLTPVLGVCARPDYDSKERRGGADERHKELAKFHHDLSERMTPDGPRSFDALELLIANFYESCPGFRDLAMAIWASAGQALQDGAVWFSMQPTLVVSEPGTGKTHAARKLAELSGLPLIYIDGSSLSSSAELISSDVVFQSARPSAIVEGLARNRVANPLVVIDEVDKLHDMAQGGFANLSEALIGLIDRTVARQHKDKYLQAEIDLSHVNFLLLANDLSRVARPVVDRCRVIQMQRPTAYEIVAIAKKEIARRKLEPDLLSVLEKAAHKGQIKSLRKLHRALDAASGSRTRRLLH